MDEITGGEKAMHEAGQIIYIAGKPWRIKKVMDGCSIIEPIETKTPIDKAILLNKIQIGLFVFLTIWSIGSIFYSAKAKADCDEIYLKVGTGYKFDEQKEIRLQQDNGKVYEIANSPYSARFETGVECGNLTYGISHHSQWATGFPFNDTGEYYKTEFFIDYKFSWGI